MQPILERIKKIANQKGVTDNRMAKELDIAQTTISNMFNRDSGPRSDFLEKIVNRYEVNGHWLLTGEGDMFATASSSNPTVARVPVLSQHVSCGGGQPWDAEQNVTEYVSIDSFSPQRAGQRIYGMRARGSSMLGVGIRDGDIVLFAADTEPQQTDGNYVFALDGDVYCKRLEFETASREVRVLSVRHDVRTAERLYSFRMDDPDIADRFCIFGRVFAWIHKDKENLL